MPGLNTQPLVTSLKVILAFREFYRVAANAPIVFLNGVTAGILDSTDCAKSLVCDAGPLSQAEARTEASLASKFSTKARDMKRDFDRVYAERVAWYEDLDRRTAGKSIGEMIAEGDIEATSSVGVAARNLVSMYKGEGKDVKKPNTPNINPNAVATGAAAVFLKSISEFGAFLGSNLVGPALEGLIPDIKSKVARDTILFIATVINMVQELAIEAVSLPIEIISSAIGGIFEGVGKALVGVFRGSLNQSKDEVTPECKGVIESICQKFSKIQSGSLADIRVFDSSGVGAHDVYVEHSKNHVDARKRAGSVLRNSVLTEGDYSLDALEFSDIVRSNIRAGKTYAASVVAEGAKAVGSKLVKHGAAVMRLITRRNQDKTNEKGVSK